MTWWADDQRVTQAKKLLKEALEDHKKSLSGVQASDASLQKDFAQMIDEFSAMRGGQLFFPYISSGLGKGALVQLVDGSVKYDFITGIGVHYCGHSHEDLLEASIDAALEDTVMQGNLQQSESSMQLTQSLLELAQQGGAKLAHCFLTSSGAMANENAFKLMFHRYRDKPRSRLLAFEHCFSGRSFACAQVTDKPANRVGLPKVLEVDYVPFFDAERPEESIQQSVQILKDHLAAHPGEHAGMIFELIQGEGGYYPGRQDFFVALMDVLKENDMAIHVDEIQTFGRTTHAFAFQYFGLENYVDVVTVGKSTQVCATLFTEQYKPQPGLISQTFTSSAAAIHAARVVLKSLKEDNLLGDNGRIAELSQHFVTRLQSLQEQYPQAIRGPFGCGAMVACTVLDGSPEQTKNFVKELFTQGVLSFMAGSNPTRVRFLMPMAVVTKDDIDAVCTILEKTLVHFTLNT